MIGGGEAKFQGGVTSNLTLACASIPSLIPTLLPISLTTAIICPWMHECINLLFFPSLLIFYSSSMFSHSLFGSVGLI